MKSSLPRELKQIRENQLAELSISGLAWVYDIHDFIISLLRQNDIFAYVA
jgi:hypothetical protein